MTLQSHLADFLHDPPNPGFLFILGALAVNAGTPQNQRNTQPAPPSAFVDKGACPFECCTYREWTATEEISLLDQPSGKKIVAHLHKSEKVQGVSVLLENKK